NTSVSSMKGRCYEKLNIAVKEYGYIPSERPISRLVNTGIPLIEEISILRIVHVNSSPCAERQQQSDRLENVTQTISRLLQGYDIRLRPNFGDEHGNTVT
ncbi:hypothetical protein L9F63_014178, partial [Diploptera punctata]